MIGNEILFLVRIVGTVHIIIFIRNDKTPAQ